MKIKILTLCILVFSINLYADAVNSGSSAAVNSDSSFNALRNPALMSRQQSENLSFAYMYSYLMNAESEADLYFGAVSVKLDSEITEDYNGAFFISDVEHSGQSSYGFGISKTGDGQVVLGATELDGFGFTTKEDKTFIGATLMLSYAYKLNNTESFGIQIETAVSSESKDSEEIDGADEKNLQIEKQRVTSGITLGYYLLENNFEFGIMFKSGRYGFENSKYEMELNGVDSDNEISNYYINDAGPGVMFGFGVRPERGYLICFGAGYIIPYSHEEKSCDSDTLEEFSGNVNNQYAYVLSGGINYDYSRFINIGCGVGFTSARSDASDEDGVKYGSTDYSIFQFSAGIDIKPSKYYTFLFGFGYNRVMLDQEIENSTLRMKLGITEDIFDIMAGVSCNY